jgi:hypothetical protein
MEFFELAPALRAFTRLNFLKFLAEFIEKQGADDFQDIALTSVMSPARTLGFLLHHGLEQ